MKPPLPTCRNPANQPPRLAVPFETSLLGLKALAANSALARAQAARKSRGEAALPFSTGQPGIVHHRSLRSSEVKTEKKNRAHER